MQFNKIKAFLLLAVLAIVAAGCLPEGVTITRTLCDRLFIRYSDTGYAGDTVLLEARIGDPDDDIDDAVIGSITVEVQFAGRVEIEFDQEYAAGTPIYVYFERIGADQTTESDPVPCVPAPDGDDGVVEETWFEPGDDRINRQPYARVAVYCDMDNNRVGLYAIDAQGEGVGAVFVPFSALPPVPTDTNTLIGEQAGYGFHRLISGEYQVTAPPDAEGKQYVVIFDGCPQTYVNTYILQNGVLTQTEAS